MQRRLRQRNNETKHREGGGTSRPGYLGASILISWLFDVVGSDWCDRRVMVADPGPGHCQV